MERVLLGRCLSSVAGMCSFSIDASSSFPGTEKPNPSDDKPLDQPSGTEILSTGSSPTAQTQT